MLGLVHVIDDDSSFRTAIARRLALAGYDVETYSSAAQLLDRLPNIQAPACILLDVKMPELNGLELQEQLAERGSMLPIVFMTGYSDTPAAVRAIKAGAEDFLTKTAPSAQFIGAIERALTRSERIRKEQIEFYNFRRLVASLTPRELQVFNLIIRGKINKQIAYELGTTERTVKAHRHQVMEKMKVHSLAELVLNAERFGRSHF
ncbi:response regulator transcription factor [Afipia sp. TerB]